MYYFEVKQLEQNDPVCDRHLQFRIIDRYPHEVHNLLLYGPVSGINRLIYDIASYLYS